MKRFYTLVNIEETSDGFAISLDGKAVNTPLKNKLVTHHQDLANEIVKEWAAQGENIEPSSMPLTQILSTKLDRVSQERTVMSENVLNFFNTDLLCYRTKHPPELAAQQEAIWDPILDWFAQKFGHMLNTTTDIAALQHDPGAHKVLQDYVENLDDEYFTILQIVTGSAGSIILALAFLEGELNAEDVFVATHIEEDFKAKLYNEEKYGADPAQESKDTEMKSDLKAAQRYLDLLQS